MPEKQLPRSGKNFMVRQIRKAKGWRVFQFGLPLILINTLMLISFFNLTAEEKVSSTDVVLAVLPTVILLPFFLYHLFGLIHPLGHPVFTACPIRDPSRNLQAGR